MGPGLLVCACLWAVREQPRYAWVNDLSRAPWELWAALATGILGTTAGVLDWAYHRWSGVVVTARERKVELLGLAGGGLTIFVLMAAASVSERPRVYAIPVAVVLVVTVFLIVYDELAFHVERCTRVETALHRLIVVGNGAAFAAWAHWCFVRTHAA